MQIRSWIEKALNDCLVFITSDLTFKKSGVSSFNLNSESSKVLLR